MQGELVTAARDLAIRTARMIRQPVADIVRRPRTQRYFLKSLRVTQPERTDDELRDVIQELELVFPPIPVEEAITNAVWMRRVKRLMHDFPLARPLKIHQAIERCRRHFGWHQELAVNVLMVAELHERIFYDAPYWRRTTEHEEADDMATVPSQANTTRKQPPVRVERVKRTLKCRLKARELSDVVERSSEVAAHLTALREQYAETRRTLQQQIRVAAQEYDELLDKVGTKVEERQVVCEERYSYAQGVVRVIRTDTGEVIEERPMTPQERQLVLGGSLQAPKADRLPAP
jgi:hypothetical protein